MHSDGDWLDHGRPVQGHIFGQWKYLIGVYSEVVLTGTIRLETHHLQRFADVVHAVPAWADRESVDCVAHFGDNARYFVSLDDRIGRIGVLTVKNVDVGTAYADAVDADQHLVGAGDWFFYLSEGYFSGSGHYCLSHFVFPVDDYRSLLERQGIGGRVEKLELSVSLHPSPSWLIGESRIPSDDEGQTGKMAVGRV